MSHPRRLTVAVCLLCTASEVRSQNRLGPQMLATKSLGGMLEESKSGLRVVAVTDTGALATAGVKVGDTFIQIGGRTMLVKRRGRVLRSWIDGLLEQIERTTRNQRSNRLEFTVMRGRQFFCTELAIKRQKDEHYATSLGGRSWRGLLKMGGTDLSSAFGKDALGWLKRVGTILDDPSKGSDPGRAGVALWVFLNLRGKPVAESPDYLRPRGKGFPVVIMKETRGVDIIAQKLDWSQVEELLKKEKLPFLSESLAGGANLYLLTGADKKIVGAHWDISSVERDLPASKHPPQLDGKSVRRLQLALLDGYRYARKHLQKSDDYWSPSFAKGPYFDLVYELQFNHKWYRSLNEDSKSAVTAFLDEHLRQVPKHYPPALLLSLSENLCRLRPESLAKRIWQGIPEGKKAKEYSSLLTYLSKEHGYFGDGGAGALKRFQIEHPPPARASEIDSQADELVEQLASTRVIQRFLRQPGPWRWYACSIAGKYHVPDAIELLGKVAARPASFAEIEHSIESLAKIGGGAIPTLVGLLGNETKRTVRAGGVYTTPSSHASMVLRGMKERNEIIRLVQSRIRNEGESTILMKLLERLQ